VKHPDEELTDRNKVNEELSTSNEVLEKLFSTTHFLIALLDRNFNFLRVNRAYAEADERSPDFFVGENHFDIYPNHENEEIFRHVIATGESVSFFAKPFEYNKHPERGVTYWDWDLRPLIDDAGTVEGLILCIVDVTEQTRVKQNLLEREKQLRQFSDATWEAIAIHDRGVLLHANEQYFEMFGYEPEELMGKSALSKTATPESADFIRKQIESDSLGAYEATGLRKNGTEFPMEIRVKMMDYYGRMIRVAAIRDLTDRKKAEEALRESEERYRSLFENAGAVIQVFDTNGICQMLNGITASYYEGTPENFVGKSFHDLQLEDADEYLERIHSIVNSGEAKIFEELIRLPSGKKRWFLSNSHPVRNAEGKIFAVQIISQDITERKIAEEQVHTLTQRLIAAQENERQQISRELHDRVAQDLSTSKIFCELLLENQTIDENVRQSVSEISKALHSTITAVRDLSYDLRPPGLEELGLIRTIFQYCRDFSQKTGVSVEFQSAGMDNLSLGFHTEINLYRVIQEGLNNIWKHANAKNANVRIISSYPNILLRIEDNGRGFDVDKRLLTALSEKRMGLKSMEERVALLQGKMSIQSRPGEGTKMFIEIPYNENMN